ncbi:hypothetical protein EYR38_002049 [Pleurotus pulmonarius]|nr:hypothetical protein EYR38_002031 [Pleurotus pulmonarius]KAF4584818.1 hypothetical protein EYR38_002049 [Pleurotus pulmonarius]
MLIRRSWLDIAPTLSPLTPTSGLVSSTPAVLSTSTTNASFPPSTTHTPMPDASPEPPRVTPMRTMKLRRMKDEVEILGHAPLVVDWTLGCAVPAAATRHPYLDTGTSQPRVPPTTTCTMKDDEGGMIGLACRCYLVFTFTPLSYTTVWGWVKRPRKDR